MMERQRPDDEKPEASYEQDEEFETRPREEIQPVRPNYNLKLVLRKLPKLYEKEEYMKCKQLLLGLHERLWHSPISDFLNLLRRAGLPAEVLKLAEEAVKACSVCRKYVRLPNRPQMRTGGGNVFNAVIQIDLFNLDDHWYMLIIDEATRYKLCSTIPGQEAEQLLTVLLQLWIYIFGPPQRVVMDQQVSLMGHETGREFERLSMERCPRGTTAGHGAEQHTGTGIVERHVQLIKLTMLKLRAELQRQGLDPQPDELGREAAMAHNITLNYKGVTPSMAVFGILPRGFYDIESDGVTSVTGSKDSDVTVFERAMRIRQTALAQAQQAVIEDRIARASRTRPHQLDLTSLVAGTSEIEFYREVKGDVGWRGPALLLRLDADEGVAVIQYQGKPYLVALRHIRPFKGIFHVELNNPTTEENLEKLMRYVESVSEYKVYLYGWIKKAKTDQWIRLPKNSDEANRILERAEIVSKSMTKKLFHGCLFGRALRTMKPPNNTTGILITWIHGGRKYAVQQHLADKHLKMKKIAAHPREDICVLYLYYYNDSYAGEERGQLQPPVVKTAPEATPVDMDAENVQRKRDGPETRTVQISPEKKKQKLDYLRRDVEFLKTWYQETKPHYLVQFDFNPDWHYGYDMMIETVRNFMAKQMDLEKKKFQYLFHIGYPTNHDAFACLRTARIYKVDEETANIEEDNIDPKLWPQIEEADLNEIRQFVEEGAFSSPFTASR